jgi:Ni/Co efflux regulator RcnB
LTLLLLYGLASAAMAPPEHHDLPPPRGDVVVETDLRLDRPGPYVPPRPGWRYRRLAAGDRLAPQFYAPVYVISNPAARGLSGATEARRWIRYGDDAVLVDIMKGRVKRVVRRAFCGDRARAQDCAGGQRRSG